MIIFFIGLFNLGVGMGVMLSFQHNAWKEKGYSPEFVLKSGRNAAIAGVVTMWAGGLIYVLGA